MQNAAPTPPRPLRPIGLALAYSAVCLLIDFWPRHGRPFFRYAGSDPARPVWNFGWPIAWVIHDPAHGLQAPLLPLLVVLIAMQLGVLAIAFAILWAASRRRRA